MTCLDDGRVRAFLDNELPEFERAAIASHLSACPRCRTTLAEVSATAQHAAALLVTPTLPAPDAALTHFHTNIQSSSALPRAIHQEKSVTKSTNSGSRRAWIASIATIVVLFSLLALPPVRAAADSLLQVFRVQQVVFVPVTEDRARQLENLNFDGKTLFLSEPQFEGGKPGEPETFATAEDAAAAGYAIAAPGELPAAPSSTSYTGMASQNMTFQVNVESARELIGLLGIQNVTIPDALGAEPIRVSVDKISSARLTGTGYTLSATSGRSPEVALPDGVDLSQLGSALLQVYGTAPEQAAAMAKNIDWTSTLVVPLPTDVSQVRQVQVNGTNAMLMRGGEDEGRNRLALYWQQDSSFYVLESTGLDEVSLIVAAESIK